MTSHYAHADNRAYCPKELAAYHPYRVVCNRSITYVIHSAGCVYVARDSRKLPNGACDVKRTLL